MEGTPSEGGLETEGAPARLMWSKSHVIKINVQNNHCTQYLMPANKNKSHSRTSGPWDLVPSGYRDLGTLSLQAIEGPKVPIAARDKVPWSQEPEGTRSQGPDSLKGQGPKVPIT